MLSNYEDIIAETYFSSYSLAAMVNRIVFSKCEAQVELVLENGQLSIINLTWSQFERLKLQPYQQVFIQGKRIKNNIG